MKYLINLTEHLVLVKSTNVYYRLKEERLDSPTGEFLSLSDLKALKDKLSVCLLDPHTKLDEKSLLAEIQNRAHMDYYELYNRAHDVKWMNTRLSEQLEKEVNARVSAIEEKVRLQKSLTFSMISNGILLFLIIVYIVKSICEI